jgi:predicted metal-dependent hydrolase
MAFKDFHIDGMGTVTVYKRRGTRNLRLSVRSDGSLRVTIPTWLPYTTGVEFARARRKWIADHAQPTTELLVDGQLIGKAHHLSLKANRQSTKVQSRVKASEILITFPETHTPTDSAVQKSARAASIRALRNQAEQLLPIRLQELADKHGLSYQSVSVKHLKTRWGSCDQDRNIVLNLFLMQLPWQLIDYVLLHELTHTRVMKHGPEFWEAMGRLDPDTIQHRKLIKAHRPSL